MPRSRRTCFRIFAVLTIVVYLDVANSILPVVALLPDDQPWLDPTKFPKSLEEECASRCPDLDLNQNRTDDSSLEVGCGVRCKIEQCSKGCAMWQWALELERSCQEVCNGTQELLPPKELYCVLGCHDALNRYFQQLKAEIGTPPAPALVADSLTATSLRLEWKGIDIKRRGGISYLVQWRYEELAETWQYCRNQSWGEDDQIFVDNLQPYTKYRFRVALLLKSKQHNPEPIVSAPSVPILTSAAGLPSSAPVIVRPAAVDSCRVSISWEPGPFPNGPLLSYVLRLQGAGYSQLKDIPASENTDHYMFRNLKPNMTYTVNLTMRNSVGEGPPAVIYISTTPEPAVKQEQQPILILGGAHTVMKQGANMFDAPSLIYETSNTIRGVAIHVASAQVFVSDSGGYIYRTSINEPSDPVVVLTPDQANFEPLSLSVDWLNMQLYVLGEVRHATTVWQIARCSLDGRGLTVAVAGFITKPSHIEVDPYNGYLFWVMKGGLFRLDLAHISNGVKHEVGPDLIVEDPNLGAFMVDHRNFRLLVPHHVQNTVISVTLDGRELSYLRNNTQQPKFKNVVSLAMANGLFYWTNGEEVLTEEYHAGHKRYFHNAYPSRSNDKSDNTFVSVNVFMDASQPTPVPVNPPTGVQAVFGAKMAKVSWQAPYLLGGQGKGAWQNWNYELEIKKEGSDFVIRQKSISGASHTVRDLEERSAYSIKAAAYTSAGRGPWSTEFRGLTLRDPGNGSYASILWSATEGLLKSDVTGENVDTLIHKSSLKETDSEYHVVDVAWYKDMLYLVGNNSVLYSYNTTSHHKDRLNINSVGSVAVDWVSKKLYWANPKQQIITRANLNGSQPEPMSILAIVKELTIDSLEAYLYWSTGHAVEVARLNGQDRRCYYSDEIFNGKQVMGLTLDTEKKFVYWIVRSYESGSILYRAPTSERIPWSQKIVPEKVSALQHPNMQGPLCYFSEHLLWLQDDRNAVIGDLSGQNTAVINGITLSDLRMVAIMDHALHKYPSNLTADDIVVLPVAVDSNTIRVEGTWRNFNVSWFPVKNVNYGTVFYEVKFSDYTNTNSNPEITTQTTIPYNNSQHIKPYSHLEVTIKAFTYWGMSYHARSNLMSPQSIPSEPINARAFVEFQKTPMSDEADIFAVFRWNGPEFPNGAILGFTVRCWYLSGDDKVIVSDGWIVPPNAFEYKVEKLFANTTYGFEVRASTEVGPGPYSEAVHVSTETENPVPQILVATSDAVRISDLDRAVNDTITPHVVVEITYSAAENKMFWINKDQEVMMADIDGTNPTKIVTANNTVSSLCIDWVTRTLFWAESGHRETGGGRIVQLDLTTWEAEHTKVQEIVSRDRRVVNLDVSPLTGKLYWIELTKHDRGVIVRSDITGENVEPFFNHNEDCSCPYAPTVRSAMTVDNTDTHGPVIYWVSMEGELNIADIDGCICSSVIGPGFNRGLPPTSLTVDKANVYWSNIAEDRVYSVNKMYTEGDDVRAFHMRSARSLKAIGKSLQPYPFAECLVPRQVSYKVQILEKLPTSITVKLPNSKSNFGCEKYNLPATRYVLHVAEYPRSNREAPQNKVVLRTFEKELQVKSLKPFTNYTFRLSLTNYYRDFEPESLELGPVVIFSTKPGAPSSPQNVVVKALTPTLAAITWQPPKLLNGPNVSYAIRWSSANGISITGEQPITWEDKTNEQLSAMLQPLVPGQKYYVFVRAFPIDSPTNFNESVAKEVKMYPEPSNLTMTSASINRIIISWVPGQDPVVDSQLEFSVVGLEKWQVASYRKIGDKVEFSAEELQPRTMYKFRLVLQYPSYKHPFVWPQDARFTYQTLGDVPSAPGVPAVTKLRGSVHQVSWEPARAHGSEITLYCLEGRIVQDMEETGDSTDGHNATGWNLYYNGTDSYWIITGEMVQKYIFRVRARNAYGYGVWSEPSIVVDLIEAGGILGTRQHLGLVLGLSVPLILGVMLLCFGFFLCVYRQRKEDKKVVIPPTLPDVELATLREIPRGNFIQSNALYSSAMQNDPDDSMLPKIKREQITLAKFLGSGAFGEVFQGNARDLEGPGITRVAIKTLRKGASAQEKTEFLQEARLMSHFKHKHVLRLLGVCMDTDPPLLVLELMKAGDLLTYLRASRPLQPTDPSALRLQDLLAMCEDVARGCRYLEELHFVHRDLACRNCLVSARDRENRVVKIGDFGLARDIYKNDYYRKEGEGLLPVRWMAPESLVDGVFTSQSDVWSFGVLMWEITSLGQQPYPARTNLEVLHHVRAGGRLPKPLNCPASFHKLMLRCWSTADARPSFKACLEHIITLRSGTEDAILSPVHAGHYLARRGVSNMAYFADENQNHNDSGNSWKSSSSEGSRDMQPFLPDSLNGTVLLSSGEIPKYLELLADTDAVEARTTPMSDYEVPRTVQVFEKTTANVDGSCVDQITNIKEDEQADNSSSEVRAPDQDRIAMESIATRRPSMTSTTSVERSSRASLAVPGEKANSFLDNSKVVCLSKGIMAASCLDEKRDKLSTDNRGSITSLSGRSISSHGSSASLALSTRPSSSLINSQLSLSLKAPNGNKRNSLDGVSGRNTISKLQRTHSTLHAAKANIPLAINSALLNSLKQTPGAGNIDDVNDVVTYTNVNSEAVRING